MLRRTKATLSHPADSVSIMFGCVACGRLGTGVVCPPCARSLQEGPTVVIGAGLVVRAGLVHGAAARRLVHNLKYRGLAAAARVLAAAMADRLEGSAVVLVPVPRAHARRIRYGIDPARELALAVGIQCGVPVVDALRPALWWPRHAPREPGARRAPGFRLNVHVPEGVVLIDDVVRTGSTMAAAARVLSVRDLSGLVATAPSTISTTDVAFLREAAQR